MAWLFMHLSEETWSSRLAMLSALLFALLLTGLIVGDISRRPYLAVQVPVTN